MNIAPEKLSSTKGKYRLLTIHFQGRAVKLRGVNVNKYSELRLKTTSYRIWRWNISQESKDPQIAKLCASRRIRSGGFPSRFGPFFAWRFLLGYSPSPEWKELAGDFQLLRCYHPNFLFWQERLLSWESSPPWNLRWVGDVVDGEVQPNQQLDL